MPAVLRASLQHSLTLTCCHQEAPQTACAMRASALCHGGGVADAIDLSRAHESVIRSACIRSEMLAKLV